MTRANGLCERCARMGKLTPARLVHHKIPLTPNNISDPNIAVNPDNLEALCYECHDDVHRALGVGYGGGRGVPEEPRVGFDEFGNVIELKE